MTQDAPQTAQDGQGGPIVGERGLHQIPNNSDFEPFFTHGERYERCS